jgi:allantoate deiminase
MKTNLERIKQDLEELTKFTATPGEGMTRLSLTEEDQKTRGYLTREMRSLGIQVYEDAAGNLFGRIEGELKDGPVVMVGSHFDSVRNGGNFDGPAGVVAGLEIARVIMENNIKTRYPVEVVAMIEEEGGRFGQGLYGSKAMAGKVTKEQLMQNRDENGISMFEAMKDFGLNPERIETARRDKNKIKAFYNG